MLQSITLINFRLHKKLTVHFDKQITCIVGKSYAGKSTIIRALRWVCLNKPSGTSMIRWGSKQCKVILKIDGHTIVRIRSKSKNIYKLDGQKFEAFKNDIPAPIAKILNISELNIQSQHSLPFWFGESAGEVSRHLNSIVNLEIIDTTLSNLNSMLNRARTAHDISKERFQDLREKRTSLKYLDTLKKDWANIQKLQKQYTDLDVSVFNLEEVVDRCLHYQQQSKKARPPSFEFVTKNWNVYSELKDECALLHAALERLENIRSIAVKRRNEAEQLEAKLKILNKGKCPLCGKKI